jgi:hypothetical protein
MFGLSAQVPEHINDKYFARVKAEAKAKKEGDIFEAKKEEYKPSEERKKDQVEVDKQVFIFCFKNIFGGEFLFLFVQYPALLYLPPLGFHCADGCWDRTQDRCNWCIDSQTF